MGFVIVAAIVVVICVALWLTRNAKRGPYAGDSIVLDEKVRQLDEAFRERPPKDY